MRNAPNIKDEAKRLLLLIISEDGLEGAARINKAFYFSHLFYLQSTGCSLSKWPVVRMPNGPGLLSYKRLLRELSLQGSIVEEDILVGPWPSTRYGLTGPPPAFGSRAEQVAIEKAIALVKSKTAAELTAETHEHSLAWQEARNLEEMDLAKDALPPEHYRRLASQSLLLERQISDLLGT